MNSPSICPAKPGWCWEAIEHKEDVYLVNFPSMADLERLDGFELGVPKQEAMITLGVWREEEVMHSSELTTMWVHVTGVPSSIRHFLGIWAVGTLIGKTLDVDLLALRRQNVVRIQVAIRRHDLFEARDVQADAFVMLKGYTFKFRKEAPDYIPEPDFVPYLWRRHEKEDDGKGVEERMWMNPCRRVCQRQMMGIHR